MTKPLTTIAASVAILSFVSGASAQGVTQVPCYPAPASTLHLVDRVVLPDGTAMEFYCAEDNAALVTFFVTEDGRYCLIPVTPFACAGWQPDERA